MKKVLSVVIDTNIFVSALLGSKNCLSVYNSFVDGEIEIIISPALFGELIDVLSRTKFEGIINAQDIVILANLLRTDAHWVVTREKIRLCRDPKDNIVLECTVSGKVDFIISGDPDLLSLKKFRNIPVITPKQFVKLTRKYS